MTVQMGNLDYLVESRYNCIIPTGFDAVEKLGRWACEYPEMFTVYTTGTIAYNSEQALSWFILKWPQSAITIPKTSVITLG